MKYENWKDLKIQLTALREFCKDINDSYIHDIALNAVDNCSEILQREDFEFEIDKKKEKEIF